MLRYLIRIENRGKYSRVKVDLVSQELQKTVEQSGACLKNFRVSSYAIEFDLFAEREKEKNDALVNLKSKYGRILDERVLDHREGQKVTKIEAVKSVVSLFNEERYWECHEVMEGVWRKEEDVNEKTIQQGIIIAASALVHAQKNEDDVCLRMIKRALDVLGKWKEDQYYGLSVEKFRHLLKKMIEMDVVSFPRI